MEEAAAVPSPLPFVVSVLPLLLSTSNEALPPATLSSAVLQRHYYLSVKPDSPSTYLQATSDSSVQDAVESRREALASTWLEDVKLSSSSEIQYSRTVHDEQKLVARLKLSKVQASQDSSIDDTSLVLLVVYEEAEGEAEGGNTTQTASSSTTKQQTEAEEESTWRYYDLQLPHSRSNASTSTWHSSIADANAALARLIPSTSTDTRAHRSNSIMSSSSGKQKETKAQKALREKKRQEDVARGLSVEEGPDQDPEDYWAGCESSDDEAGKSDIAIDNIEEDDNEDDYWNNYGSNSPGNSGSIVDSGHHESERPPDEEDSTMRYDQENSDSIGHFEYAQAHHTDETHQQNYSFEQEHSIDVLPAENSRVIVDSLTAQSGRPADAFLSTLQSSLERVSSSQEDLSSSQTGDNQEQERPHQANGYMNGNGHAGPRIQSPTIDSAISKSISGLWETYLLSSALGGGGKSREIAAYEFMELVQAVVNGEME